VFAARGEKKKKRGRRLNRRDEGEQFHPRLGKEEEERAISKRRRERTGGKKGRSLPRLRKRKKGKEDRRAEKGGKNFKRGGSRWIYHYSKKRRGGEGEGSIHLMNSGRGKKRRKKANRGRGGKIKPGRSLSSSKRGGKRERKEKEDRPKLLTGKEERKVGAREEGKGAENDLSIYPGKRGSTHWVRGKKKKKIKMRGVRGRGKVPFSLI